MNSKESVKKVHFSQK